MCNTSGDESHNDGYRAILNDISFGRSFRICFLTSEFEIESVKTYQSVHSYFNDIHLKLEQICCYFKKNLKKNQLHALWRKV